MANIIYFPTAGCMEGMDFCERAFESMRDEERGWDVGEEVLYSRFSHCRSFRKPETAADISHFTTCSVRRMLPSLPGGPEARRMGESKTSGLTDLSWRKTCVWGP